MKLTDQQTELVEKIGVSLECKGQRPAAARIIGLLFVADTPTLSFEEITDALQLSKSAISNALALLLRSGQLEYITHSGDRKRYFRLRLTDWQEGVLGQVKEITGFSLLLRQVLELRSAETPEFNHHVREISSFMEYISAHLPELLEAWKRERFLLPL